MTSKFQNDVIFATLKILTSNFFYMMTNVHVFMSSLNNVKICLKGQRSWGQIEVKPVKMTFFKLFQPLSPPNYIQIKHIQPKNQDKYNKIPF